MRATQTGLLPVPDIRLARPGRIRPTTVVALLALLLLATSIVTPHLLTPWEPLRGNYAQSLRAPSWVHPFGTDRLGRDVLSRVVFGARYSLMIGVGAMLISVVAGVTLGIGAGLRDGWFDEAVCRVLDVFSAFPGVLLHCWW